jgi:hypothetical protein
LDYEIAIERIPEFEHLILPMVLTGLVPFVRRLTRSRRTQRKCSEAADN